MVEVMFLHIGTLIKTVEMPVVPRVGESIAFDTGHAFEVTEVAYMPIDGKWTAKVYIKTAEPLLNMFLEYGEGLGIGDDPEPAGCTSNASFN